MTSNDVYQKNGIPMVPYNLSAPFPYPADAAYTVPRFIAVNGGHSHPRGMAVIECLWVDFNVLTPEAVIFDVPGRNLNPRYTALEICSLLSGVPVDAHQRFTAHGFAKYQDSAIQRGNYGVRVRNQLRDIVRKLKADPYSRQACMTIFDGTRDLIDDSKDIPCTLAVQAFLRDDLLYMRTTMRSNDAYLGLPYDLAQFCALQTTLADIMQTSVGFYRHSVGSMHLYVQDVTKVEEMTPPNPDDYPEPDGLWSMPDTDDPEERLEYVIRFCQDALYGQACHPGTEFEHWLLESL